MDDRDPLEALVLPAGARLTRTTPEFTAATVPDGLRRAHRVADDVWGRLCVSAGIVVFVDEASGQRRTVGAGESQIIEPGVFHHVEPGSDARFAVEFHRLPAES